MPHKDKPKKSDDEILNFSKYKYSDKLETFAKSDHLLENKSTLFNASRRINLNPHLTVLQTTDSMITCTTC